jgi:predicted transcriptional regulator
VKLDIKDYIVIPAFVVIPTEEGGLGLRKNDAIVYSIIYGFSKDGESWFEGSQSYLAEWCGSTRQGVQKNLNHLLELGLIERAYVTKNGNTYVNYRSCHPANFVGRGMQKSLHHNIEHNISPSDIDSNESISSPPKGKSASFVAPSIDDVLAYCAEHEFSIDPYEFFDHYQGNGWMAGKVKMKDWKATLRNWERRKRKGESYR